MKQSDLFLNLNYDFLRADKGTGGDHCTLAALDNMLTAT